MPKKETGLEHICELPPEEDFAFVFLPEDTIKARVRRCVIRRITITTTDIRTMRFFKSTKAINLERDRHLKNHMNIVHPFSPFRRSWNAFMLVVYLYAMLFIPVYVAFICTSHEKSSIWILLDLVQCFLSSLDIIVNFFTGYVQNSETIVLLSWKIFVYYLRTFLVFDLISCVPFDHIICFISGYCPYGQLIASLRLLKFVRICTLHKYIRDVCYSLQIAVVVAEVLWILIAVFFTVHLLCCLQYLLGYLTAEYNAQSWVVEEEQMTSLFWLKRYMASFFRASTAFLNMGFGLTNPESPYDQVFVVIIAGIGAILLIIFIGKFLQWTYISNSSAVLFGEMIQQLNSYMKHKRLPSSLKKRLVQYYQFRYQDNFFNVGSADTERPVDSSAPRNRAAQLLAPGGEREFLQEPAQPAADAHRRVPASRVLLGQRRHRQGRHRGRLDVLHRAGHRGHLHAHGQGGVPPGGRRPLRRDRAHEPHAPPRRQRRRRRELRAVPPARRRVQEGHLALPGPHGAHRADRRGALRAHGAARREEPPPAGDATAARAEEEVTTSPLSAMHSIVSQL